MSAAYFHDSYYN